VVGEVLAQTCSLVVPRHCPCGAEGVWLCRSCRALLQSPPLRVESVCDALQELSAARVREEGPRAPAGVDHEPVLSVHALGEYAGPLQRIVLAWKNGGMSHLVRHLAPALVPAVEEIRAAAVRAEDTAASQQLPVLVPVPSRLSARLRRGEDHVHELVRELEAQGAGRALALPAVPSSAQEGKGARQRRRRRILLLPAPPPAVRGRGRGAAPRPPVVIVDDVVTTGSTLRGMHEALTAAGWEVIGAAVIASARLPAPVGQGRGTTT
jgi:predicted amidophosphoribosyltransferase